MKWNPRKLPREKRLTPEQLSSLPPLNELKLENKILRAFPSSPIQKELKQQLEEMREARRQKESKTMKKSNDHSPCEDTTRELKKSNDAYGPVNKKTLGDVNRANARSNDSTVPEPMSPMMDGGPGSGPQEGSGGQSGKTQVSRQKAKSDLEAKGYKNVGLNKSTGAMIYKHPKEKGSVLLTPEGEVLANE